MLRWSRRGGASFHCPICDYRGPFLSHWSEGKRRVHALCPACGSAERHRLQVLVLEEIAAVHDLERMSVLHVAPEPCFHALFRRRFRRYASLDRNGRNADYRADLCRLPFADRSFDFVFASHVLEHIQEDGEAIAEIARILRPDGVAVVPVPVIAAHTVEYGAPNPHEAGHVRAPGLDYYDRCTATSAASTSTTRSSSPRSSRSSSTRTARRGPRRCPCVPRWRGRSTATSCRCACAERGSARDPDRPRRRGERGAARRKRVEPSTMPLPIEDYALIGDCQTAALVGRDGSIDWLCLPRFDSGACFAALLGTNEHGRWRIAPEGDVRSVRRRYREGTLVLETDFETADGAATLVDCMPPRADGPDLVRLVIGRRGTVRMGWSSSSASTTARSCRGCGASPAASTRSADRTRCASRRRSSSRAAT
jgi:hypothetical protein